MAQNRTPIEQVWSAKGNLPNNAIVATADGKYPALDGSLITGIAGAGDMNASVYDPTTIQADAFARVNHTGTQLASTISDFDTEVANNSAVTANTAKVSYTDSAAVTANTAKVTNATHTGDVTGATALTIGANKVTLANMATMATASLLGRNTAATGNVEVLSKATALTLLNVADGATANSANATLLDRANHTGTQLAATISDFDTEVGLASSVVANSAKVTYPSADSTKLAGYSPIAIITESTTARSLALTDIGAYIRLTNAASCTITLPANATVAWAGETEPPTIYFRVAAAGIPTLSNAGVTVNDTLGVVAALEAGSTFALQWVATDVWDII